MEIHLLDFINEVILNLAERRSRNVAGEGQCNV